MQTDSTSHTMSIYEREAQLVIDYSELEAELRVRHQVSSLNYFFVLCVVLCLLRPICTKTFAQHTNTLIYVYIQILQGEELEVYLEKLRESVLSIEGVLHRTTAPNLKALEKMREVKQKLHGVKEGISLFMDQVLPVC